MGRREDCWGGLQGHEVSNVGDEREWKWFDSGQRLVGPAQARYMAPRRTLSWP
jgi:hypothetical protein